MHYLKWLLSNGIFAICIFLGFVNEIEGFKNIALFMGWSTAITAWAFSIDKVLIEHFKRGAKLVPQLLDQSFDFVVLCAFTYYGHFVLSIFYLLHIALLMRLRDKELIARLLGQNNE
ncbi:MAG: hypothetical protein WC055_00590 [Melioribacteraceae bacterium]